MRPMRSPAPEDVCSPKDRNYGELWGIMGNYGELWGIMANYGELWGFMGYYGVSWGYMGNYGELWGSMGLYGELWVWGIMGNYGELWGIMGNYGILWGIMRFYGVLWDFMGFYGELWGAMGKYLDACATQVGKTFIHIASCQMATGGGTLDVLLLHDPSQMTLHQVLPGGLYRYDKRTYKTSLKARKSESDMSAGMSTKGIRKTLALAETLT